MTAKSPADRMWEMRSRRHAQGEMQITIWVPENRADEIRKLAADLLAGRVKVVPKP